MTKDIIYIYDKLTRVESELGEIQSDFNIGLTINGDKDSCKVIVWSYSGSEIEPNSICYHKKTNTWWIVKNDKVERLLSENGFVYVHNLQLIGAIELFNVRDLTDCGFNQNTYTVLEFIRRLLSLSSLEINCSSIVGDSNFSNKKVDYVKTYENYTLLSALRDFLDGYNMCAKLNFSTYQSNQVTYLHSGQITLISKSGDNSLTHHNINDFDDAREIKTMHQDSFGTTVISNAENVISNRLKVFPNIGSVLPSSKSYNIRANNGILRLPSDVYKGEWLKIVGGESPVEFYVKLGNDSVVLPYACNPCDLVAINEAIKGTIARVSQQEQDYPDFVANVRLEMANKYNQITEMYFKAGTATLYNGNNLNAYTGDIVKGDDVPYLVNAYFLSKWEGGVHPTKPLIFCDEETRNSLPKTWQGIYYKRGSNLIEGFDCFDAERNASGGLRLPSDLTNQGLSNTLVIYSDGTNFVHLRTRTSYFETYFSGSDHDINKHVTFIVGYIPMSNIKIKVDNQRTKRDVQLYNQNGKLTDNFALSKMINSYSKEISSDTITRYKQYYDFADVPKVGSFVHNNNELYVINNVSMELSQNEKNDSDFGYYIETEITMSKYVSTKSMMINPNTNIRDYGIPQNYNVKRRQLYRDYYELDYVASDDREWSYYLNPRKTFKFGSKANENDELTAIMKITYGEQVNGSYSYYYQLPLINFYMCKMLYCVLDFNDNNIIGYGSQNAFSGFDVSRIFRGMTDDINTPISYVDSKGQAKDFDILVCNNEELEQIYAEYEDSFITDADYLVWKNNGGTFYNYIPFVTEPIYTNALSHFTMRITENNYKKDATEVPVFEYACQVDDSDNVLIGDNILTQREDCLYLYSYVVGDNLTQDTAWTDTEILIVDSNTKLRVYSGVNINVQHENVVIEGITIRYSYFNITMFGSQIVEIESGNVTNSSQSSIPLNKDIAIFRHYHNTITGEEGKELLFIVKNVTSDKLPNPQTLRLQLNHYKLN